MSALEVGHIWDKLVARYDIVEYTNLLNGFVKDPDLKWLMAGGIISKPLPIGTRYPAGRPQNHLGRPAEWLLTQKKTLHPALSQVGGSFFVERFTPKVYLREPGIKQSCASYKVSSASSTLTRMSQLPITTSSSTVLNSTVTV